VSKFVRPYTKTLTLPDGDTLTVRTRLNAGEQRKALRRMFMSTEDGTMKPDPLTMGIATVVAFLVDWNLKDDSPDIKNASAEDLEAILDNLDPDAFKDIQKAIEAHEIAMAVERAEEKKRTVGATASLAISTSPHDAIGGTNG
jgi:hypothetical protein